MSSKRQQVRNERTLQELVKTVPGNNTCADCFARNPAWASWSLGIFLCMRCAGLHRKLGTHISKVKSLSMDSWTNEQVEFMKRTGNIASNRIYNPTNSKPNVPLDVDEVDPAMERYIREKYVNKDLHGSRIQPIQRRHDTGNTGSTESDERLPSPSLPPKTSSGRFGFKAASSMFPMSSKKKKAEARAEAEARDAARSPSPPIIHNKPSRIFGNSVGESNADDLQWKVQKLRDMGFHDEKRAMTVLKGFNGNLEKTIDSLARLGEGPRPSLPPRPSTRSDASPEPYGISFDKSPPRPVTSQRSNNPFDMPTAQPQSSQSTGTLMYSQHTSGSNPYQSSTGSNPFGPVTSQSQRDFNEAFQTLSVSNSSQSQTLFPHRTGGFPSQHHPQHQKFLPSLETSIQAVPQQYPASTTTPYSSAYNNFPLQQPNPLARQQQHGYTNPFLQQTQAAANGNGGFSPNPFLQHSSTFPLNAPHTQQQQQPSMYAPQQQQTYQPQQQLHHSQSYDWSQPQPQPQPQQQLQHSQSHDWSQSQTYNQNPIQYQQQAQAQAQWTQQSPMTQQTGRVDKNDIMALFNYPHLAPVAPQMPTQPPLQSINETQTPNGQVYQQSGYPNGQQMNSAPPLANHNPFMNANGNGQVKQSRESILVEGGGWMNGRHSPDAFASLSTVQTRSMR